MILLVHMTFGAAIASMIENPFLAVILAFLSHYLIDFIPHIEYDIKNIRTKNWKKSSPDILKIMLDLLSGALLVLAVFYTKPVILISAFFSTLPDWFTLASMIFPNKILRFHDHIHRKKIHFLKDKKIPVFLRILTQILITTLSVILIIVFNG